MKNDLFTDMVVTCHHEKLQISRLQLFEIINELFIDTVVTCHHEKLFTVASLLTD